VDQYLRIRYFIATTGGVNRTATELVFPTWPEYRVKAFGAFRASYQDRAMNTMLERFHEARGNRPSSSLTMTSAENPYLPLARFFSGRYEREKLSGDERVERIEIWHGFAPNPPPGAASSTPLQRLNLLSDYYTGLVDAPGPSAPAGLNATEREGDIVWTIEFIETK
jgi:hypothetical protein